MATIGGVGPKGASNFPQRSEKIARLQQTLNTHFDNVPARTPAGANLAILQQGREVHDNPIVLHSSNIPDNAAQHWGSVSKQFTAACIAQLVEKGILNWEDDISKFLTELPSFLFEGKPYKITIDDLLHMRSGLPETTVLCPLVGGNDETMSISDKIKLLQKSPYLIFAPDSQGLYCNTNYYLLAEIVARVSGKSFVDYIREELFIPLGMNCRCAIDPTVQSSIDSYTPDRFERVATLYNTWGAGGIVGRPSDIAGWNAALNNRQFNSLLNIPASISPQEGQSDYARGLNIADCGDYRAIFHSGGVAAFITQFVRLEHKYQPDKTFAFFLTMNLDDIPRSNEIVAETLEILAGEPISLHLPGPPSMPPEPVIISSEKARQYEGRYTYPELQTTYEITALQKNKTWILQWALIQGETRSIITDFTPLGDPPVFHSPIDDILELTASNDILFHAAKTAPFILRRQ